MKLIALLTCALSSLCFAAGPGKTLAIPDFTKGDTIPAQAKHDWNLGPTGLRGWMFSDKMVTSDARQIAITQVDATSPADGSFVAGDVLLGVAGKPFASDPRTELGKAITLAESAAGQGKLTLTRWRAGKTEDVTLQLATLGNYSATAPFDCEKSQRIFTQGCQALATKMAQANPHQDAIVRSLNALALLASGDPQYLPLLKKEAQWAADYTSDSMQTWHYGYVMIFLAEYIIASEDKSVLPGLRRLALEAAKGQSAVGSWGHGFAIPDGRLGGYGMMNSPGIPLTISLSLAIKAGVKDPEIPRAIELSARLLRFYIGKGAVPYGDHHPWIENHDDNGKCGMAAVLFQLLEEPQAAEFFSRMSVACHGPERDTGHTGNYFNMLWAMPGVARSGPQATGAWMKEFGAWYYDLARKWDGSFAHQGPPDLNHDSYRNWDCSGAFLLAYAMPLQKIALTGKRFTQGPPKVPQLDATQAQALINDGRGWNNKDRNSGYDQLSKEEILSLLRSWSPIVRERAAMALGRRKDASVPELIALLSAPEIEARYGACQALAIIRGRGADAIEPLLKLLNDPDLWLRIKAAEALATMGDPAKKAVPRLLELLAQVDTAKDPRGMQQRYLSFALFDGGGMLNGSLKGVDRKALYTAVRAGLKNQDGRARGSIGSVYRNLSVDEIKPLLPAIYEAIVVPAPSGEMFADTIRVEGLRLMAQHHIKEGMSACVTYTRQQNPWASEKRTPELMKILLQYGTHAKALIPDLNKLADYFEHDEKNFPKHLMRQKAQCLRDTIKALETSTDTPKLQSLK
jgi:hypothetical protein